MAKDFIDNFSFKSKEYSFSRPVYPNDLFEFLGEITPNKDLAWDCATGNGQAAIGLCKYFKKVIASDASKEQIDNKFERENILYKVFPAEASNLPDKSIDLVTMLLRSIGLILTDFITRSIEFPKMKKEREELQCGAMECTKLVPKLIKSWRGSMWMVTFWENFGQMKLNLSKKNIEQYHFRLRRLIHQSLR